MAKQLSVFRVLKVISSSANGCEENTIIASQNLISCYTQYKIMMEKHLLCRLCFLIILKLLVGLPASSRVVRKTKQKQIKRTSFAAANGKTEIASSLLKSLNSSDESSLISSPDNGGRTVFTSRVHTVISSSAKGC